MDCSINSDYRNDDFNWYEIDDQIENIAKAGFTHIQWIHDWEGEYLYSLSEMHHIRDILRDHNLKGHTLHAAEGGDRTGRDDAGKVIPLPQYRCVKIKKDYTSTRDFMRLAGVELIKNRIDLCALLGIHTMALHLMIPFETFRLNLQDKANFYAAVYKSFDEIEPYAKNAGVRIALENLFPAPLKDEDEKFERIFNRYDSGYMGLCFDSGHATLSCLDNFYYYLEKYNDRLFMTHLQDTDSIDPALLDDFEAVGRHDSHRPPFTGVLDWDRIARGVAAAPKMKLPADFEVVCRNVPKEEEPGWLRDCLDKAEKFHAMVLRYKNDDRYNKDGKPKQDL